MKTVTDQIISILSSLVKILNTFTKSFAMISCKTLVKLILLITVPLITCSCKTEKQKTQPAPPDTRAVATTTIPKRLFYDSFPPPTGTVNDYERLFTLSEINTLTGIIKAFEKETTIQIAVITFDSVMTTADDLEATTFRIANYWGVGQKGKSNGIVIGLSQRYRKMRIENGKGIEQILTDAETKTIIDKDFIPLFKQGKYFEGMKTGLLSLMRTLRKKYTA